MAEIQETCKNDAESNGRLSFAAGVVEGFYGKPWSYEQRKDLFKKQERWGMNCYLYAPKDDYKHRSFWRDPYSEEEAKQLSSLINESHSHNITFYYAIAPGLDITYSDPKDHSALKQKLGQIQKLGCTAFAILFDDIESELKDADKDVYESFAQAQVAVTNDMYHHLCQPKFMFCPTEYCSTSALPNVKESKYLKTVGLSLNSSIDILWTGPLVVSKTITCDHIKEVADVLKRPPIIWENLHANDYDRARLYLGPFSDRPPELVHHLRGFLTNPNCEYGPNFVAIHTLSQWLQSSKELDRSSTEEHTRSNSPHRSYNPREALSKALEEWLPEFSMSVDAFGSSKPPDATAKEKADDLMEAEPEESDQEINLEDLELLAGLFYLPFEHGKHALAFLKEFKWLKENVGCVIRYNTLEGDKPIDSEVGEWHQRAEKFGEMTAAVKKMAEKVVNIKNRSLLYDIYSYISNAKGVVATLNSYVEWIKSANYLKEPFVSEYRQMDLWLKRGGVPAELHKMLGESLEEFSFLEKMSTTDQALRKQLPSEITFGDCLLIRPYVEADRDRLYNLILRTASDGYDATALYTEHPHLQGDLTVGAFMECDFIDITLMVVEDHSERLQGFCLSIPNAANCYEKCTSHLERIKEVYPQATSKEAAKVTPSQDLLASLTNEPQRAPIALLVSFPSYVLLRVHPQMKTSITKRLLSYSLDSLRRLGCNGVHAAVKIKEENLGSMYACLGFKTNEDAGSYRYMTMAL